MTGRAIDPYHHGHSHVEEIAWSRLGVLLIDLAERVAAAYVPEVVVGIAKGGVIPAAYLSSAFLVDFFPIKLSSRHNEQIVSDEPVWHVRPTPAVAGRRVLVVDDIAVAGRTLRMAEEALRELGALDIHTVTLAVHGKSHRPDTWVLETDALIVWPWDRDVLAGGNWRVNTEYLDEMKNIPNYAPGPTPSREALHPPGLSPGSVPEQQGDPSR